MKELKAKYFIEAEKKNQFNEPECFMVGKNNDIAEKYENYMVFNSEADAEKWIYSEQSGKWTDCNFRIVSEEHF